MTNTSSRNAFAILRRICAADAPLGATEISRDLGIPTTTTHRALVTLDQAGFVSRYQSSAQYVLGDASRRLLQAFFGRFHLRDVAIPYLRRLAVETGETASLIVPVGWYAVRIASIKGTRDIVHTGPLGEAREMNDGAGPLVLLAFAEPGVRTGFLQRLALKAGEAEALSLGRMADRIRQQGFATGTSPSGDIDTIAIPLTSADEVALAAVGLEGMTMPGQAIPEPWLNILHELGRLVRRRPDMFRNHYSHIDPATIELATGSRPGDRG